MPMTDTEQVNEFRIHAYDQYLKGMNKSELLAYFNDMSMKDMIECVKFTYGNDGKDDCIFEY
jgi:hypothetical protein